MSGTQKDGKPASRDAPEPRTRDAPEPRTRDAPEPRTRDAPEPRTRDSDRERLTSMFQPVTESHMNVIPVSAPATAAQQLVANAATVAVEVYKHVTRGK